MVEQRPLSQLCITLGEITVSSLEQHRVWAGSCAHGRLTKKQGLEFIPYVALYFQDSLLTHSLFPLTSAGLEDELSPHPRLCPRGWDGDEPSVG